MCETYLQPLTGIPRSIGGTGTVAFFANQTTHGREPLARDVRSRFFETPNPILLQNYRILLQSCSGLRQKSKLQLLFSLLLLEEVLQTLQSQCYPNFRPMLNFMQVR